MDDRMSFRQASAAPEPGSMVKVTALVPRTLHEAFLTVMPQKGALVWTVRAALESVVHILQNEPGLRHRIEVMLRRRINEVPDYLAILNEMSESHEASDAPDPNEDPVNDQ